MKPIVVLPTYNEKENITEVIKQIFALSIPQLEVIVVDDNSPDGTAAIIKDTQYTIPNLHLIQRLGKLGLGSAYITGFKRALELDADYVLEMDADLSHDPRDIPKLLSACDSGADLAIGSRKVAGGKIVGWSWWRRFISAGAMFISRLSLNLQAHDVTAGFRCYRRRVLQQINLDAVRSDGYAFQEEMLYKTQKNGFNIVEIPVTFIDRKQGKSKLSKRDIIEFFWVIFKLKCFYD